MKVIVLSLVFIISSTLWAQYSPGTEWLTIKTEHFNIIYDKNLDRDAQNIANDIENYYKSLSDDLSGEIDRYTIVLPADSIVSNGYVNPTNNKSVFYPVPPLEPFAGATPWYKLLSIHETRHMAQFSFIRDSILERILELLFGSYGITGALFIPSYMYEGDAVLTETLLSDSGRGRYPGFERGLRTILLNDKNYSFSKALLQSGRDFVPNYYVLGYYLITYLKIEYGTDILPKIINSASNNPLPLNFSTASLFATGKTMPSLYKEVKNDLYWKWSEQDSKINPTVTEKVKLDSHTGYVNRKSFTVLEDERVLYIEESLNKKGLLIENSSGKRIEHKIITDDFSTNGRDVIYVSQSSDARWIYSQYSDIYKYNLDTRKSIKLSEKQRYLTARYSNKGDKIAVIEYSKNRIASVLILENNSMEVLKKFPFSPGEMINSISWSDDDKEIILSKISENGSSIGILNLNTKRYEDLTAIDNTVKTHPLKYKNYLIYVSTYSGIENINSVNIDTKEIYQVVSSRFGVNYPEVFNDNLYFSQYSIDGYNIEQISINRENWTPLADVDMNHVDYFEPLLEDRITPNNELINYKPTNYNPNTNLIDVHSWLINPILPAVIKSEVITLSTNDYTDDFFKVQEVLLFSSDYLDKMDATFYSHYNYDSESFDLGSYGLYRGFYPIIGWDFNLYSENISSSISTFNNRFSFQIPLTFYNDDNTTSIAIGIAPEYYVDFREDGNRIFDLSYFLSFEFSNNNYEFISILDFNQAFNTDFSSLFKLTTNLSTVGLLKFDSFNIYNSTVWSVKSDQYPLNSELSVDYNLPLFYPDLTIFNWVYFRSVDIKAGYDYIFTKGSGYNKQVGVTLKLNYNLLRAPVEWYTSFEYYYDFNKSEFVSFLSPIVIKTSL